VIMVMGVVHGMCELHHSNSDANARASPTCNTEHVGRNRASTSRSRARAVVVKTSTATALPMTTKPSTRPGNEVSVSGSVCKSLVRPPVGKVGKVGVANVMIQGGFIHCRVSWRTSVWLFEMTSIDQKITNVRSMTQTNQSNKHV
jgi:hypothetical protein